MAASARRHMPLLLSIILAVCMCGKMGRGSDASVGKAAACGGYAYTLPEGFTGLRFHRTFAEFLPVSELTEELPTAWRSAIVCITVENKAGNDFIIGKVKGLVTGSERQKSPLRSYPKRYEAELPEGIRLYAFDNQYHSETEMDFSQYLLELKASGNEDNVLLYILDETFHPVSKEDPRTLEQVEADKNKPRKERAMRLIDSVRRLKE